jgi:GntR family histidine utilization transcriptional repressor
VLYHADGDTVATIESHTLTSTQSLYQQIREAIEEKIFSGAWPPGFRIPIERELMDQFGCSRMTVNKAVTSLVDTGFLERRKKAGTFVTYPSGHYASLHIPDIRKAVLNAGFPYRYVLRHKERRPATADDLAALKLNGPADILDIRSLHYAADRCFAAERRRINLAVAPEAATVDFVKVPPSVWLLTHVPWSNAEHDIDADAVDGDDAAAMALADGSPVLRLTRRTWGAAGTITEAEQIFPAGALTLHASFLVKVSG